MTEPRYDVILSRPADTPDPLGGPDRLIVDNKIGAVVALVHDAKLADAALVAFTERDMVGDAPVTLELGPTSGRTSPTGEEERALTVDLTHHGYVEFRRRGDDRGVRILHHEVATLMWALGRWRYDPPDD